MAPAGLSSLRVWAVAVPSLWLGACGAEPPPRMHRFQEHLLKGLQAIESPDQGLLPWLAALAQRSDLRRLMNLRSMRFGVAALRNASQGRVLAEPWALYPDGDELGWLKRFTRSRERLESREARVAQVLKDALLPEAEQSLAFFSQPFEGKDLRALPADARFWALEFYQPWSEACAGAADAWNRVARHFGENVVRIHEDLAVGRVSCEETNICLERSVSTYPVFQVWQHGSPVSEYAAGSYTYEELKAWIYSASSPNGTASAQPAHGSAAGGRTADAGRKGGAGREEEL